MKSRAEVIKQPVTVVMATFVVLLCAAVLRAIVAPYACESTALNSSPLAVAVDSVLGGTNVFGIICTVLVTILTAAIITRIITRYSVTVVKTLVPSVLFALLSFSTLFVVRRPSVALLLLAIVRSSELLICSFRRDKSYGYVALSGFWLGTAIMLFPPTMLFVVVTPIILSIYKRTAREALAWFLFVLVPIVIASLGWWFAGFDATYIVAGIIDDAGFSWSGLDTTLLAELNIATMVSLGAEVLAILAAVITFLSEAQDMRLRVRNINIQFILLLFCATAMLFLGGNPSVVIPIMGLCCVPTLNLFFVGHGGVAGIVIYIILIVASLVGTVLQLCL